MLGIVMINRHAFMLSPALLTALLAVSGGDTTRVHATRMPSLDS